MPGQGTTTGDGAIIGDDTSVAGQKIEVMHSDVAIEEGELVKPDDGTVVLDDENPNSNGAPSGLGAETIPIEEAAEDTEESDPVASANPAPLVKYMTLADWIAFANDKGSDDSSESDATPRHVFEVLIDDQTRITRKPPVLDETAKFFSLSKSNGNSDDALPPSWSKVRALQLLINSKELIAIFSEFFPKFGWSNRNRMGKLVFVRPYKFLVLFEAEIRQRYELHEKARKEYESRILGAGSIGTWSPPTTAPPSTMGPPSRVPSPLLPPSAEPVVMVGSNSVEDDTDEHTVPSELLEASQNQVEAEGPEQSKSRLKEMEAIEAEEKQIPEKVEVKVNETENSKIGDTQERTTGEIEEPEAGEAEIPVSQETRLRELAESEEKRKIAEIGDDGENGGIEYQRPPDDEKKKAPIRFKDAVGRKFSFPWHLCKTWKGIEGLIRQAFLHVDIIGQHVFDGHYDLVDPDGNIILPQVWESVIKPDWAVSMQMWPMPEPPRPKLPLSAFPPPPPPPPPAMMGFPTGNYGGLESLEAHAHLGLLIRFMDEDLQDMFELRRRIHDRTLEKIAFDDLWHLFDYGQEVFIRDKLKPNEIKAAKVLKFTGGRLSRAEYEIEDVPERLARDSLGPGSWGHAFVVQCWTFAFDSHLYWPQEVIVGIRPYEGEIEITSLPVYPSRFADPELRRELVERGEIYRDLASTTSTHRRYLGRNFDENARGEQIDSEVIIDFKEALTANEGWEIEGFSADQDQIDHDERELWEEYPQHGNCDAKGWCIRQVIGPDFDLDNQLVGAFIRANKQALQAKEVLEEDEVILLPDRVFGYVLNRKTWAILTTAKNALLEIKETRRPWDDLVLQKQTKHIVEALVNQHIQSPTDNYQSDVPFQLGDFIAGKGRGLVLLLHGPPGVGKTSTAECIAAYMNKPLYPLTSGNLPVRPGELEVQLQVHFNLAERWGCILLLDEADVFLQRRRLDAIEINAMVSVFLRQLEYYNGILFLTTNRVGDMDPAFKSRIHVSLEYEPLDRNRTHKIYKLHLKRIKEAMQTRKIEFKIRKDAILRWAMDHFEEAQREHRQWNGRQIHNAFQTALALAEYESYGGIVRSAETRKSKELVLGKKQFAQVAAVSEGFDQYMTDLMGGQGEADRAVRNMMRYDYRRDKMKGNKTGRFKSDKAKTDSESGSESESESQSESQSDDSEDPESDNQDNESEESDSSDNDEKKKKKKKVKKDKAKEKKGKAKKVPDSPHDTSEAPSEDERRKKAKTKGKK